MLCYCIINDAIAQNYSLPEGMVARWRHAHRAAAACPQVGRPGGDEMVRPAPAALRATQILDFLVAHPTQGFTLSQIARANDMNVATARTVLAVLTDAGYLVRHGSSRTFALGPLLVAAGNAALERYPAVDVARKEINRVSREFGVELLLTVAAGDDIVAVARAGRVHPHGIDV